MNAIDARSVVVDRDALDALLTAATAMRGILAVWKKAEPPASQRTRLDAAINKAQAALGVTP